MKKVIVAKDKNGPSPTPEGLFSAKRSHPFGGCPRSWQKPLSRKYRWARSSLGFFNRSSYEARFTPSDLIGTMNLPTSRMWSFFGSKEKGREFFKIWSWQMRSSRSPAKVTVSHLEHAGESKSLSENTNFHAHRLFGAGHTNPVDQERTLCHYQRAQVDRILWWKYTLIS